MIRSPVGHRAIWGRVRHRTGKLTPGFDHPKKVVKKSWATTISDGQGNNVSKSLHAVGRAQSGVSQPLQKRNRHRIPWGERCQLGGRSQSGVSDPCKTEACIAYRGAGAVNLSCPHEWPLVWTGKLTPGFDPQKKLTHRTRLSFSTNPTWYGPMSHDFT